MIKIFTYIKVQGVAIIQLRLYFNLTTARMSLV